MDNLNGKLKGIVSSHAENAERLRKKFSAAMGVDIAVASDEECEQADMVVCVLEGQEDDRFKADNVYTTCAACGAAITHRPHAPKKPRKVCIQCAVKEIQEEQEGDEAAFS